MSNSYVVTAVEIDGPPNSNPFFITFDVASYVDGHRVQRLLDETVFRNIVSPDRVLFPYDRDRGAEKWQLHYRQTMVSNDDSPVVIHDPELARQIMQHVLVSEGLLDEAVARTQGRYDPKLVPQVAEETSTEDLGFSLAAAETGKCTLMNAASLLQCQKNQNILQSNRKRRITLPSPPS